MPGQTKRPFLGTSERADREIDLRSDTVCLPTEADKRTRTIEDSWSLSLSVLQLPTGLTHSLSVLVHLIIELSEILSILFSILICESTRSRALRVCSSFLCASIISFPESDSLPTSPPRRCVRVCKLSLIRCHSQETGIEI